MSKHATAVLPPGWAWTTVAEIGEVKLGRQRSPKDHHGPHMRPYLRVANVYESRIDVSDVLSMNFTPDEYKTFRLLNGDILLNEGQSLDLVGRPAIYRDEVPGACFQNTLIRFRPSSALTSEFALVVFRSYLHMQRFQQIAKWTTNIAHLGAQRFSALEFPLAPVGEQRRITELLDSYETRLDDAVVTLERVQRNLKRYRASVLKAAVEGRLVPTEAELARAEKRDYEPASELLKRILAERRRRWNRKGKYEEPAAPDTSNLPELPEGWCWARADALYWDAGYGTSQKCAYDAKGPPVLRIPNVQDQFLRLDDLKHAIDPGALARDGAVEPGDFLFIRTNGSKSLIGRGALVREPLPMAHHFASYLIRLRLLAIENLPQWFTLGWHSPIVRDQLMIDAASSAGQHNVSLGAAMAYAIPLPPALEQRRIVSEVERLTSVAMASQVEAEATLSRCMRLRQSILRWAFEGKLVDQDPDDEPASALLERIRAQKTARTA